MAVQKPRLESGHSFALALHASSDGFWDLNLSSNQAFFSPQWQKIIGCEAHEYTASLEHWLDRVHPDDRARLVGELRALRMGKARQVRNQHRLLNERGMWRWVMVRALSEENDEGKVVRIAGALTDQTERKLCDTLTGLPNRLFFVDHLERRFAQGRHQHDWSFALLSMRLERFKLLNERLGYEGGDALLVEIANRLRKSIARHATTSESVVARLNAADFLLCLENIEDEDRATAAAQQLSDELRDEFQWRGRKITPVVAIGLVKAELAIATPEELMHDADAALAEAQSTACGQIVCYSNGMRERAQEKMQMESDLEQAIRNGHLVLHYQPEIDLATRRIIGFEALMRWPHPERGMVMPGEFIPLAEETGLIHPLGEWGLMEACRQIAVWRDLMRQQSVTGEAEPPLDLRVSVNLSARQFGRHDLVERVAGILAATAIDASDLRLEVTESSLMSHEDTAQATMQGLQQLGVGLHMDDFGTGYSSLNHLHRYPFDTLKIDRSFIRELASEKSSAEIVRTILDLAHSLNMEVVAEGIETEEQASYLRSLGCRLGQGYYFATPMSPEAINRILLAG